MLEVVLVECWGDLTCGNGKRSRCKRFSFLFGNAFFKSGISISNVTNSNRKEIVVYSYVS